MRYDFRHLRSLARIATPAATRSTGQGVPTLVLALAVLASLGLSALTANRIARIRGDYRPALQATRQLGASLDATRALLTDTRLGSLDSRMVRADSQAERFHRVAIVAAGGAQADARMLAYGDAFGAYYVAARRAAAGLSMSAEADGRSVEDAELGYRLLHEDLAAGRDAQSRAINAARPTTAPIELAAWLALGLIAGVVLVRRISRPDVEWPVAAELTTRAERPKPVDAPMGAVVPLHEAVERLARQRLAASIAAARVAKRNNERQIEVARSWIAPTLSIVRPEPPRAEMDVYEDDPADEPRFGGLALVLA